MQMIGSTEMAMDKYHYNSISIILLPLLVGILSICIWRRSIASIWCVQSIQPFIKLPYNVFVSTIPHFTRDDDDLSLSLVLFLPSPFPLYVRCFHACDGRGLRSERQRCRCKRRRWFSIWTWLRLSNTHMIELTSAMDGPWWLGINLHTWDIAISSNWNIGVFSVLIAPSYIMLLGVSRGRNIVRTHNVLNAKFSIGISLPIIIGENRGMLSSTITRWISFSIWWRFKIKTHY